MQGRCPYCHQFDPVLKQLAQQYGFSVFPTPGWSGGYCLSGSITGATGRDADLLPEYPGGHTDHLLVNVNTLEALPLLQGATDAASFMARMDTVLQIYGEEKGAK